MAKARIEDLSHGQVVRQGELYTRKDKEWVVELGRRFGALDELESMKTLSLSLLVAT